jgi:DNA-binding XRE family transcriptional regulator
MEKVAGQREIAQQFGVAKSTAGNINKNRNMNLKDS